MLQGRSSLSTGWCQGELCSENHGIVSGNLEPQVKRRMVQLHCAELGVLLPASPLTGKMEMGIGIIIIIIIIQYLSRVFHAFIT